MKIAFYSVLGSSVILHNPHFFAYLQGMSTLKKINPKLQWAVTKASLPLKSIRSRAKPWFDENKAYSTLLELDVEEAIRKTGGETEEQLIVDGEVMAYTIMRGALQV